MEIMNQLKKKLLNQINQKKIFQLPIMDILNNNHFIRIVVSGLKLLGQLLV